LLNIQVGRFIQLFMKQPLMNKCSSKPDCKAGTKHNPQVKVLTKANKSRNEKQNTWQNSPQSSFNVIGHEVEITRIVHVQPDEYDEAGQWHYRNQSGQFRQFAAYLRAKNDNAQTNRQPNKKSDMQHLLVQSAQM
jgi:hypothetical protein